MFYFTASVQSKIIIFLLLLFTGVLHAQSLSEKLDKAVKNLEADSQMKSALIALYVVDKQNKTIVFGKNQEIGLAAASTQKVITSVAALELLGTGYRYKTSLAYNGTIQNGILNGNLFVIGYGDPTLGSWRYDNTKEAVILSKWLLAIKQAGIKQIEGNIIGYDKNWESQTIPGGWVWDDIGNYYGAGASALNWRENQYDLVLRSGNKEGDKVTVVSQNPLVQNTQLINELTTGKPGSGDNAYIYLPPYSTHGFVRGTIPPNQNNFVISGAVPNPAAQLAAVFSNFLQQQKIVINATKSVSDTDKYLPDITNLVTQTSPPLDSINYWFLRKSINLYGEALVKTLGYEKMDRGATEAGLNVIKNFWKKNGIASESINMSDGSGLSPANRITAAALVKVMEYARSKPWFSSFYNALPEINGIRMKSGVIGGVRSFTGYTGSYTFAIIINNYNGASNLITTKMYKILDLLK